MEGIGSWAWGNFEIVGTSLVFQHDYSGGIKCPACSCKMVPRIDTVKKHVIRRHKDIKLNIPDIRIMCPLPACKQLLGSSHVHRHLSKCSKNHDNNRIGGAFKLAAETGQDDPASEAGKDDPTAKTGLDEAAARTGQDQVPVETGQHEAAAETERSIYIEEEYPKIITVNHIDEIEKESEKDGTEINNEIVHLKENVESLIEELNSLKEEVNSLRRDNREKEIMINKMTEEKDVSSHIFEKIVVENNRLGELVEVVEGRMIVQAKNTEAKLLDNRNEERKLSNEVKLLKEKLEVKSQAEVTKEQEMLGLKLEVKRAEEKIGIINEKNKIENKKLQSVAKFMENETNKETETMEAKILEYKKKHKNESKKMPLEKEKENRIKTLEAELRKEKDNSQDKDKIMFQVESELAKKVNYIQKYKEKVTHEYVKSDERKRMIQEQIKEIKELKLTVGNLKVQLTETELRARTSMKIGYLHPRMMQNVQIIGQGGFGSVKSCLVEGVNMAVKEVSVIRKYDGRQIWDVTAINDLLIMSKVRGHNILNASHFGYVLCQNLLDCKILIGMDLWGVDLHKYFTESGTNESWMPEVLMGTLLAVEQLHDIPVMHRDLKPENFLVKGRHVKVCDFGISTTTAWAKGESGTPGYIAPEVYSGKQYDLKVDVYSTGCVHHLLMTKYSLHPDSRESVPRWFKTSPFMKR